MSKFTDSDSEAGDDHDSDGDVNDVVASQMPVRVFRQGLLVPNDFINNRQLVEDQLKEFDELRQELENLDQAEDPEADWTALQSELQKYKDDRAILAQQERELAREVNTGFKNMEKWMRQFQSIADLQPSQLVSLRDKLPPNMLPTLIRLLILCYDDPDSIQDLPRQYKDVFVQDQRLALASAPPPPSQDVSALQMQLQAEKRRSTKLQQEVDDKVGDIEGLHADLAAEKTKVEQAREQRQRHMQAKREWEAVEADLRSARDTYKNSAEKHKKNAMDFKRAQETHDTILADLQTKIEDLEANETALQATCSGKDRDIGQLQDTIDNISKNDQSNSSAIQTLNQTIQKITEQRAEEGDRHRATVAKMKNAAKADQDNIQATLNRVRAARHSLLNDVKTAKTKTDDLQQSKDRWKKEAFLRQQETTQMRQVTKLHTEKITRQQEKIRELAEQLHTQSSDLQEANVEVEVLRTKINSLTGRIDKNESDQSEIKTLQDKVEKANTSVGKLQKEASEARKLTAQLKQQSKDCKGQIQGLTQRLEERDTQLGEARMMVSDTRREMVKLGGSHDEACRKSDEDLRATRRQLDSSRADMRQARQDISELRKQVDELHADARKHVAEEQRLTSSVVGLGQELEVLKTAMQANQAAHHMAEEQSARLQRGLTDCEQEKQRLQLSLANSQQAHGTEKKDLQQRIDSSGRECEELRIGLTGEQQAHNATKEDKTALESRLATVEEQLLRVQESFYDERNGHERMTMAKSNLEQQLEAACDKLKNVQEVLANEQNRHGEMAEQRASLAQQVKTFREEVRSMQASLVHEEKCRQEAVETNSSLEQQLRASREEARSIQASLVDEQTRHREAVETTSSLEQQLETRGQEMREIQTSLFDEQKRRREAMETSGQSMDSIQASLIDEQKRHAETEEAKASLEQRLERSSQEKRSLQASLTDEQKRHAEMVAAKSSLEQRLESFSQQNNSVARSLADEKREHGETKEEKTRLADQVSRLHQNIQDLERVLSVEKENHGSTTQYSETLGQLVTHLEGTIETLRADRHRCSEILHRLGQDAKARLQMMNRKMTRVYLETQKHSRSGLPNRPPQSPSAVVPSAARLFHPLCGCS